ncbi:MAG: phosphohistidine phosphatase SixA [Deferrisomatales bacterium]|nr:phosphohistidine phosphatase SixA [Deferrisomatales bacterium]
MKLYLIQTGDAVARQTTDFERPLSDQGRLNMEKLASLLSRVHLDATRVIHSGNTRARQTLEIFQWAATPERGRIEAREGLGPEDPVEPWLQEISGWEQPAVLVGHQPFLGKLVSRLVAGREEPPVVAFCPGTAVCLTKAEDGWSLCWMVPPELMKAMARY